MIFVQMCICMCVHVYVFVCVYTFLRVYEHLCTVCMHVEVRRNPQGFILQAPSSVCFRQSLLLAWN